MLIKLPDLKKLHGSLSGVDLNADGDLEKKDYIELSGRDFYLDPPLKLGSFDFEKDHENYSACLDLVAIKDSAFKGLSAIFSDNFFALKKLNEGGYFHQTSPNGTGYIIDKERRAVLTFNSFIYKDDDKKFPARQIIMGEAGSIARNFNPDSSEVFMKEISTFQEIANLYIHSVYMLAKSRNRNFQYDPNRRVVLTTLLSNF